MFLSPERAGYDDDEVKTDEYLNIERKVKIEEKNREEKAAFMPPAKRIGSPENPIVHLSIRFPLLASDNQTLVLLVAGERLENVPYV